MPESTLLTEKGFEKGNALDYHKRLGELEIILEEAPGGPVFRVPCASVRVDTESEIEKFAGQQTAEDNDLTVTFRNRLLTVTCRRREGLSPEELLDKPLKLIESMKEQFDLLPVCMLCGRVLPVEPENIDGKLHTVCSVCKGSRELDSSLEKQLEQQRQRYADEYTLGGIQRRPVKAALKAGFLGGLYTSIIGALYMSLLWVFLGPLVHLLYGFFGAIAGFFTIRKCNRINHIPAWQKFALSTVSAFATLFVLSGITFLLLNWLMFHGAYFEMFKGQLYDLGHPVTFMIVFGLGTFFLSEFLFGFMFPGKRSRE